MIKGTMTWYIDIFVQCFFYICFFHLLEINASNWRDRQIVLGLFRPLGAECNAPASVPAFFLHKLKTPQIYCKTTIFSQDLFSNVEFKFAASMISQCSGLAYSCKKKKVFNVQICKSIFFNKKLNVTKNITVNMTKQCPSFQNSTWVPETLLQL